MTMIRRIAACLVTVSLLWGCLAGLTDLLERKSSDFKYEPFFAQREDFDVLFFGTSHVINGVFPMELWKDYGIVSYNFGGHGNAIATSYWVMKNALDHTRPELVVIDGLGLAGMTKTSLGFSQVHLSMDAFPFSLTKWSGARDLLEDEAMEEMILQGTAEDGTERTKMSIWWDFSVYHSRWNELGAGDFIPDSSKEKGAESRIAVSTPADIPKEPGNEGLEKDTVATDYLKRMIQDCREQGIEVLLVYLPFPYSEGAWAEAVTMGDIAQEYGVRYINFLDMDLVDYDTDCYDPGSHLNPSGARKVTDYLGTYITKNYDLPDHREDGDYDDWKDDYKLYQEYKASCFRQQQQLDTYLMLLADKNYNALIEINDPAVWNSEFYTGLLKNLGIRAGKKSASADCIYVRRAGKQVTYASSFHPSGKAFETLDGTVRGRLDADGIFSVLLDGRTLYEVTPQQDETAGLRIAVLDQETMELVDLVSFSFQTGEDIREDYLSVSGAVRQPESEP